MVYTVIPYRLPQRPRWGLPRAVGMDSSGVRGQRASQSEESGGFFFFLVVNFVIHWNKRVRWFLPQYPHWQEISPQPCQTSSFSASRIPIWGVVLNEHQPWKYGPRLGKPWGVLSLREGWEARVRDGGRGGKRVHLWSPLWLVWASGKVPDGHRLSRRSVPGTGPVRFLRTPLALGKLGVFSRMTSGGGRGGIFGLLGAAGGLEGRNGLASPGLGVGMPAPPWLFLWEACASVVEALGPLPTHSTKGKTPRTARSHAKAFLGRFQKTLRVFPDWT